MKAADFESALAEGKANSLGRTLEVVEAVLQDHVKLEALFQCYFSDNQWVRLRVSNALKRVYREHPDWLIPYIDRLITDISTIDQASTQWTLAQLFLWLQKDMTSDQIQSATQIMQTNLTRTSDWIVQNATMETLGQWAREDQALRVWLMPKLEAFTKDRHKSVANRARKLLAMLVKEHSARPSQSGQ